MDIKIFQIDSLEDTNKVIFKSYASIGGIINPAIYRQVYAGTVKCDCLEEVYAEFNRTFKPEYYSGRSMTTSDIICILTDNGTQYYYCDNIGFVEIKFDETRVLKNNTLGIICRPGEIAIFQRIDVSEKSIENLLGGPYRTIYPFNENVCILIRENSDKLNRSIKNKDGYIQRLLKGPFIILGGCKDNYFNLSLEQYRRYRTKFRLPETFF